MIRENEIFISVIRDPLFLRSGTVPETPCTTLINGLQVGIQVLYLLNSRLTNYYYLHLFIITAQCMVSLYVNTGLGKPKNMHRYLFTDLYLLSLREAISFRRRKQNKVNI